MVGATRGGDAFGCRRNMNHHFDRADRHFLSVRERLRAAPFRAHMHGGRGAALLSIFGLKSDVKVSVAAAAMATRIKAAARWEQWGPAPLGFLRKRGALRHCPATFFSDRRSIRRSKIKQTHTKKNPK